MPIPLIAAGVAAVGGIAAAKISSNATNKASQASQSAADAQIANANANRDYQYNLNAPTIQSGATADSRIAALLGLGGDQAGADQAFAGYRDSTGFNFRQQQGENAVNSNAYARGMGNSGATLKALTQYGQNIGSQEFGNYLGQLGGVSAAGANARGLVAGVGNNAVNGQAQALANNATNQGNAAIAQGNNLSGTIGNLAQIGGYALQSSYNPQQNIASGGGGGLYNLGGIGTPSPSVPGLVDPRRYGQRADPWLNY